MSAREFLEVKFLGGDVEQDENVEILLPFANSELFRAPVVNAKLLTKGEDVKRVFEITIGTKGIDYKFQPGDTIGILPTNNHKEIDDLFSILQLQDVADLPYRLCVVENCRKKNASVPKHLPKSGTLRRLFLKHLDIRNPPKKVFLKFLADAATSETDKEKLNHVCSPSGSGAYFDLVSNEGRSLLGLLKTFPSCKFPVARLLEHLPPLKPRPYSISSSPLVSDELKITFSLVQHEDGSEGVSSGFLSRIADDFSRQPFLPFYFRKPTKFHLPCDNSVPVIMIGPGVGVAPFIGFLRHRYLLKNNEGALFGKAWLFFGCRYADRDYVFRDELELFLRAGVLSEVFVSFSRETDRKCYVQHNIEERGKDFADLILNENASVYVCGDAKNMCRDVKNTVVNVLAKGGNKTKEDVEIFVAELQKCGRYVEDAWL